MGFIYLNPIYILIKVKKQNIINILPYIIGMVFIFSGISKLVSVVFFEQFIYSFGVLSLNQAVIFARLVIAGELLIGTSYILHIYLKQINIFSLFLLIIFTIFIVIVESTGFSNNCHCFGNIFTISNKLSVIKNILLITLSIFALTATESKIRVKSNLIFLVALITSLFVSLAVYFPSNLFSETEDADYCTTCLDDFAKKEGIVNQKKILCFFSTSCEYCLLAGKNMEVISRKAKTNKEILYVLWKSNKETKQFLKETNSTNFNHQEMFVVDFINLTKGKMPLIILYNKSKVEHAFHYSDINEKIILDFIGKE